MMLRTVLPLPILGFIIFLMVDSEKRFKDLKTSDPEFAKDYERQFALLMTLLVILAIILLSASFYGMYVEYPTLFKRWFNVPAGLSENMPAAMPAAIPTAMPAAMPAAMSPF